MKIIDVVMELTDYSGGAKTPGKVFKGIPTKRALMNIIDRYYGIKPKGAKWLSGQKLPTFIVELDDFGSTMMLEGNDLLMYQGIINNKFKIKGELNYAPLV